MTESKFQIQQEKDCGVCKTHIYLIYNSESKKEFWMHTKPEDIPSGEEWKPHFHNPSWCKRKEKFSPQKKTTDSFDPSTDLTPEDQSQKDYEAWKDMKDQEKKQKPVKTMIKPVTAPPPIQTADQVLLYDRSFKLVKMKIFKARKVSQKTIPSLNDFEMRDYYIEMEVECELGAEIPRLAREHFAKIENAISQEIQQDILRGIPEDK